MAAGKNAQNSLQFFHAYKVTIPSGLVYIKYKHYFVNQEYAYGKHQR